MNQELVVLSSGEKKLMVGTAICYGSAKKLKVEVEGAGSNSPSGRSSRSITQSFHSLSLLTNVFVVLTGSGAAKKFVSAG